AHVGLTPRRLGWHARRGLALATTVRVVTRGHDRAAHRRAAAHVPRATGLADLLVLVVEVAHLADGRHADGPHPPHLTRREADGGVIALLGEQLRAAPRRPDDLSPAPGDQLDVVDLGAERD